MTGIDSKLTPRLSFVGHVGVGLVNSYQTGGQSTSALNVNNINPPELGIVTSTAGVVPFRPQVGTATSILADLALSYQLLKTTSLSLTAAQAVVPTDHLVNCRNPIRSELPWCTTSISCPACRFQLAFRLFPQLKAIRSFQGKPVARSSFRPL